VQPQTRTPRISSKRRNYGRMRCSPPAKAIPRARLRTSIAFRCWNRCRADRRDCGRRRCADPSIAPSRPPMVRLPATISASTDFLASEAPRRAILQERTDALKVRHSYAVKGKPEGSQIRFARRAIRATRRARPKGGVFAPERCERRDYQEMTFVITYHNPTSPAAMNTNSPMFSQK
jgi:hypothetical protein